MTACEHKDNAALYALGLLDSADAHAFEQHLPDCRICSAEVSQSGNLAHALASALPPAVPPPGLRDRVLAESVLPRGVMALVRGREMVWRRTPFDGITVARLYTDAARGEAASLVRMKPGARYPAHRHAGLEHSLVLEGDITFDDYTLAAGDYCVGGPDRDHSGATTQNGCLVFLIHNLSDHVYAQ